jgi:hypothetical protein
MEMSAFARLGKINTTHVIQFPSGRWGYVGAVPVELAYADGATEKQIEDGRKFGERFGPKRRTFATKDEALAFAKSRNHPIA